MEDSFELSPQQIIMGQAEQIAALKSEVAKLKGVPQPAPPPPPPPPARPTAEQMMSGVKMDVSTKEGLLLAAKEVLAECGGHPDQPDDDEDDLHLNNFKRILNAIELGDDKALKTIPIGMTRAEFDATGFTMMLRGGEDYSGKTKY